MIAYLDTNVVIWLAQRELRRLSTDAKRVLKLADLLVSPMTLLEVEYLYELNRTKLRSRDVQKKLEF